MCAKKIDYGDPVEIIKGRYKGRVGYYDDDSGDENDPLAIIYFGDPLLTKDVVIKYDHISPVKNETLIKRKNEIFKIINIYTKTKIAYSKQNSLLLEYFFISDIILAQCENSEMNLKEEIEKSILISQISSGESKSLEFKSTLRWDVRENKINNDLEFLVVKTIAAFANSEGGNLFLGITDNGSIFGLELDYLSLKGKKNRDGFLLYITGVLDRFFSKDFQQNFIDIKIYNINNKDICAIKVKETQRPTILNHKGKTLLFVRRAAETIGLNYCDAIHYVASRKL